MIQHLLTRQPLRASNPIELEGDIAFQPGRVSEICGPARRALAVRAIAKTEGPVIWVYEAWETERIMPAGMAAFTNPSRVVFVDVQRQEEGLWTVEETVHSGAAAAIVMETGKPPGLTAIRRIHLAAEKAKNQTLILLLTPETGGAAGVESRWHIASAHERPEENRYALTRLRARMAPPKVFTLIEERP